MEGNTLDKAKTLEVLASAQSSLGIRADLDVIEKINEKSLQIIKEI